MSFWMRTIRKLISIARSTYNARKFWTRRTSGSVHRQTIAWKYVYKNLTLHSGSTTHPVVMHVRSSACDRSSHIDYWTLNSRNVNSMFAASGRFFHSQSHIVIITKQRILLRIQLYMECHKLLKLYITNWGECKTWTVDMDWTMDCFHARR